MSIRYRFVEKPCWCGHPKSWHQQTGPCVECYLQNQQNQEDPASGHHPFSEKLPEIPRA
ncbi:MAG: hypothetical protein ACE5Q6_00475 [Dehalococcoidia bacterium]